MAVEKEKKSKSGFFFKLERILTSIIAGGLALFIAIRIFDAPLWVAVSAGLAITFADLAIFARLEWSPNVRRIGRK